MSDSHFNAGLNRNLRLIPWYALAFRAFFWNPVFFLFFNSHFTVPEVLRLEAIYYAGVVLLEAPSGYFSDVVGRRITLIIAALGACAGHALFFFGDGFYCFAAAQLCLATGISFNSGTITAIHYDSLDALGLESEFGAREAVVERNGFLAEAISALLGGLAAVIQLRYAYGLSFVAAMAALVVVLGMREPALHRKQAAVGPGFTHQLRLCVGYARKPGLLWLFAFVVLMTVLNHVPFEFYQPYTQQVVGEQILTGAQTPAATGVIAFVTLLAATFVAARSMRIRDRFGLPAALLVALSLQVLIIGVMGLLFHPLVLLLVLLRSCPRALMAAPLNAAIAPEIPQQQRATYLSLQSLAGRLAFSGVLVALSLLAQYAGKDGAGALLLMLRASFLLGVVGLIGLGLTSRRLKRLDNVD